MLAEGAGVDQGPLAYWGSAATTSLKLPLLAGRCGGNCRRMLRPSSVQRRCCKLQATGRARLSPHRRVTEPVHTRQSRCLRSLMLEVLLAHADQHASW